MYARSPVRIFAFTIHQDQSSIVWSRSNSILQLLIAMHGRRMRLRSMRLICSARTSRRTQETITSFRFSVVSVRLFWYALRHVHTLFARAGRWCGALRAIALACVCVCACSCRDARTGLRMFLGMVSGGIISAANGVISDCVFQHVFAWCSLWMR